MFFLDNLTTLLRMYAAVFPSCSKGNFAKKNTHIAAIFAFYNSRNAEQFLIKFDTGVFYYNLSASSKF